MITINNEIRGIILDLDGVITDTSEYHYLVWKNLLMDLVADKN